MSKEKKTMNSDWQIKLMTALRVALAIHAASGFAQAVSAGFFLSGRDAAVGFHGGIARFMMIISLLQVIAAVFLWKPGGQPPRIALISGAIFLAEIVQIGTGFTHILPVHVPLAVGIILGLVRLSSILQTAQQTAQQTARPVAQGVSS
ncbi:MAG: hypothetical protein J2P52_17760 [Blastocatellia bacterium]|nr:hypothetical protein [Blastocatellia bacterium]